MINLTFSAFSRPQGVVGDGVSDDTAALQQALVDGPVFLANGTYRISSCLLVPRSGVLIGESREGCLLLADAINGPALSAVENDDNQQISNLKIGGTATEAIKLRNATHVSLTRIHLTGIFENGVNLSRTWGSYISDIATNGSSIEKSCFVFGEHFNGNHVSLLYTSNVCQNNILIDNATGSSGHGCHFSALTCQRGDVGLNIKKWQTGGLSIDGLYTEDTAFPVALGDDQPVNNVTLSGSFLRGPSQDHRLFQQRGAHIQINQANGISLSGISLESYDPSSDEFLDGIYYGECQNINISSIYTRHAKNVEGHDLLKMLHNASSKSAINMMHTTKVGGSVLYMKAENAPHLSFIAKIQASGEWSLQGHTPPLASFPPA